MGFCNGVWKVEKPLLPVKVHYFLFCAALSCVLPFRTVFAKQLGISATAVGVIFLAIPFIKIVTNPLFGFIVDYFKKIRLTLSLTMVFVAVTHLAMLYIPPLHRTGQGKLRESDRLVQLKFHCSEEAVFNDISYLEYYNQLESNVHKYLVDVSCDITCHFQSPSENFEETTACVNNISLKSSQLIRKSRLCNKRHSIPEESVFMYQNSTIKTKIKNKLLNIFQFIKDKRKQECLFTDYTASENKMESTTNGNLSVINALVHFKLKDSSLPCILRKCKKNKIQEMDSAPSHQFLSSTFWLLFVLTATSSVSFSAVCFAVDAVCYEMLDNKSKFGIQRLWGTIGWGLGVFVGGYLNQLISTEDSTIDYSLSFYLLSLLIIVDLIPVSRIRVKNVKYSPNICKDVCLLFSNAHLVVNIFMVFAIGVVSGLLWNYQFWFMEEIGSSQVLMGLSQIVECWIAEVPCFMISGWVIRKIGYTNCNSLTFFCCGIRYLFFAYMQNPWMTLPVGLLHGPTFGIFFASMTMFGKTEAPPGTEATVQSILAVAFEGLGCGTGCILGGIGFDTFGSRKTFLYTGIACFILLALNVLLHTFVKKKPSIKEGLSDVEAISNL